MSRTLFIQLERLGDLIQTTPLLREYRAAQPETEIHLLLLDENQSALVGFGAVDQLHLALRGDYDARADVPVPLGQAVLPDVRRLDHMVIDADDLRKVLERDRHAPSLSDGPSGL